MSNDLFAPPKEEELDTTAHKAEPISSIDDNTIEEFLKPIRKIESSDGKNLKHPVIKAGLHAGDSAIGDYALMPKTIDEIVTRSGSKELSHLKDLDATAKKSFLEKNPHVQKTLAKLLATQVIKKAKGDTVKAAYMWNQGHNLDPDSITDEKLQNDYVQKFKKASGKQDTRMPTSSNSDLFAPVSEQELPQISPVSVAPEEEVIVPEYSSLKSAGLGALQGGTLGFADEIEGGIMSLLSDKSYSQARDDARLRYDQAQSQNPGAYLAGNIGGGVATSFIPGMGGANLAKLAGLGAVTGLGTSKADLTQGDISGAAIDTAVGAGTGYIAGKLGQKVNKLLDPKARQAAANTSAARALGAKVTPETQQVGETLVKSGKLPLMGGSQALNEAATEGVEEMEKQAVPFLTRAQQVIQQNPKIVNAKPALTSKIEELTESFVHNYKGSNVDKVAETVENLASYWHNEFGKVANNPIALRRLRGLLDDEIKQIDPNAFKFGNSPDPQIKFLMDLRNTVNEDISQLIDVAGQKMGGQFGEVMRKYSNFIKAEGLTSKLVQKDIMRPPGRLGLKDMLALGGAAVLKSKVIAGVDAAKVGSEMVTGQPAGRAMNIISAKANNALAEGLNKVNPKALTAIQDAAKLTTARALSSNGVQSGIQNIYSINDEKMKEVADNFSQNPKTENIGAALNSAIEAGDETAKNKILFAAEQRPDTRMLLREMLQEDDQNLDY